MVYCDALIGQQTVFPILANKWPLHSFSPGRPDGDPITGTKNTISITIEAHPDKNTKIQIQKYNLNYNRGPPEPHEDLR